MNSESGNDSGKDEKDAGTVDEETTFMFPFECSSNVEFILAAPKVKLSSPITWCLDSFFSKQELHSMFPRKILISLSAVAHISTSGLSRGVFASLRAPR